MSKFFENFRAKVKRIPDLIAKRLVKLSILGDSLEFQLPPVVHIRSLKHYLEDLVIKVNDQVVYDANAYPFDYDIKWNEKLYLNQEVLEIFDKSLKVGDKLGLIVPNRPNISTGNHRIIIKSHSEGVKANFSKFVSQSSEDSQIRTPQIVKIESLVECKYCGRRSSHPNQVICEYCGFDLKE